MTFASSSSDGNAEIALVNPPFGWIFMPSIQLGLLKSLCVREGIAVDDVYWNVDFAQKVGVQLYNCIGWFSGPQMGEWLFGECAFGADVPPEKYVDRYGDLLTSISRLTGSSVSDLLQVRQTTIPHLVSEAARALARYRIIGFTSTFQQNVAALALARAIKAIRPDAIIVLGGSNMHGPMGDEFFRAFDFLDYVVTGEADHIVAPLFRGLLEGGELPSFDGVLSRHGTGGDPAKYPMYSGSMDRLPVPDYSSYFLAMREAGFLDMNMGYPLSIPFESSRGCWWGQKHHCTFCGLNSVGMAFRAKSAERVIEEIETLQRAHGIDRFDATDNIIARDHALLGRLSQLPRKVDLFYEIKSNVGPKDAAEMAAAGIKRVQPGIESFSTRVLKLMDKGVSGLHNINALRWLSTFGVNALYNILFGFPDEELADYEYQRELIPKIVHVPPPAIVGRIWLDRFSPNFEREDMRSQFSDVRPAESYSYLYPSSVNLERAAYHFEGVAKRAPGADKLRPLFRDVDAWKASWGQDPFQIIPFQAPSADRPKLEYRRTGNGGALILDGRRTPATPEKARLNRTAASLLESLMFRPTPIGKALQKLASNGHREDELLRELSELQEKAFLVVENSLGLALPILEADDELTREYLFAPVDRSQMRVALPVI